MRVLIVGDIHGHLDILWGIAQAAARSGIGAIIQGGDFGFYPRVLVAFQRMYHAFPLPIYAIDGNHEDHQWLSRCVKDGTASEVWAERLNLFYQPRGSATLIGGARVGFLGGALHADRPQESGEIWTALGQEPDVCNWIRPSDRRRAADAWTAAQCDLVVTHSCPGGIGIGMAGHPALRASVNLYVREEGFIACPDEDIGEHELSLLVDELGLARAMPRNWVYGHFHRCYEARIGATRYRCVGSGDATGGDCPEATIYDTTTGEVTSAPPLRIDPAYTFGPQYEPDPDHDQTRQEA